MSTVKENSLATRLKSLMETIAQEYRRADVVSLFLLLRSLFLLGCFVFLVTLTFDWIELAGGLGESELWLAWNISFLWSAVIIGFILVSVFKPLFQSWLNGVIGLSLLVDAWTVYITTRALGGINSSMYHAVYLLIAFHSYYFPSYLRLNEGGFSKFKYLLGGGSASILCAMAIFYGLTYPYQPMPDLWLELSLQIMTAITLTVLKLKILERYKQLKRTNLELNQTRAAQDTLTLALQEVIAIAKIRNKEELKESLNKICATIGENLQAEFCSIGFCDRKRIERLTYWTAFKTPHSERTIKKYVARSDIKNTLLESILFQHRQPFNWDAAEHGDLLDPANAEFKKLQLNFKYEVAEDTRKNILQTQKLQHLLIVPLFLQTRPAEPLGYLQIINRLTNLQHQPDRPQLHAHGFTDSQVKIMAMVASQLAVAFENFQVHQDQVAAFQEENFLNSLVQLPDLDEILNKSLQYLNPLTGSRVASLWVPTEDGIGAPEEITKAALRSVYVGDGRTQTPADLRLQEKLQRLNIFALNACYAGKLLTQNKASTKIHYENDLSQITNCWAELEHLIASPHLLAIPIPRYSRTASFPAGDPVWQGILGFAILRPRDSDFELTASLQTQLERFAAHLGIVIEQARYRRRYNQIVLLKNRLGQLPRIADLGQFSEILVDIVKEVLEAEACSLFTFDSKSKSLVLKASTATQFKREIGKDKPIVLEKKNYIGKAVYALDGTSITGEIFKRGASALIYDVFQNAHVNKSFMEETASGRHQSLLGATIVKSNGDKLGVLRCINRRKKGALPPIFIQGDKELMELIVGIITGFIENAEKNAEKAEFLRQLSHEFATPLRAMDSQIDYVESIFNKKISVKDPEEQFQYLREETAFLKYMIQDIQFIYGQGANFKSQYNFARLVDLRPTIDKVRKLLIANARYDKEIDIRGYTSQLPLLHVDTMRLEQVFYNLLHNAVKYSKTGAHDIEIQYDETNTRFPGCATARWHAIQIKNWGIGIIDAEQDMIFQEYKRGSNTSEIAVSGTGLGLAVSKEIVQNHDGFLKVTRLSWPTIFTVFLPDYLKERRPSP